MDHKAFLASLPAGTRTAMTTLSNARGLWHLTGHFGVIAGLGAYVGLGLPGWPLALFPLGVALAFLFTLQHECTHRTPFRTPWFNEVAGHLAALILVQPFEWFRAFHMAHHRFTNDPSRDPELAAPKPVGWRGLAWHLSALGYWRDKTRVLWANASGQATGDFIPERKRRAIQREAQLLLVAYGGMAAFSVVVSPVLLWVWLIPLALGFPVLRLYLLAEHGRCPHVANMFDNSRTTLTSRVVRFLTWNMPYHAEHHAWPTVPFHHLPEVHALAKPHLRQVTRGYRRFARDWVADFDTTRHF